MKVPVQPSNTRAPVTVRGSAGILPPFAPPGQEFGEIDHGAFVGSCTDHFGLILALDSESKLPTLHCNKFDCRRDIHSDGCCGDMSHINVRADGALARREVGAQGLDAGPFNKCHHERGREYRRHVPETTERRRYGRHDQ